MRNSTLVATLGCTGLLLLTACGSGRSTLPEDQNPPPNAKFPPRERSGTGAFHNGPRFSRLAQDLGMTVDELQQQLAAGKTIQQIAAERGVKLPTGSGGMFGRGGRNLGQVAQQLGMSVDELQKQMTAGKTIQQLAKERGIELPPLRFGSGSVRPSDAPQQ